MKPVKQKYNLPVITAEVFQWNPKRFELRKGTRPDAPPCPYGHRFKWIGYDNEEKKYVRVTKSVFKKLINQLDSKYVEDHECYFEKLKEDL